MSIEERPEIVDRRERLGDWEADTIIGAGKQGAIVTLVERKSRFTLLKQVARRTAAAVEDAIFELLIPYQAATHTITFDNEKENLPTIKASPRSFKHKCILLTLMLPGNVGRVRIPMDSSASTSQKDQTSYR